MIVDDADEPIQVRPLLPLAAAETWRNREPHHIGDRPSINPKAPTRLTVAQAIPLNGEANATIQIYALHPPPCAKRAKGYLPPQSYSGATGQTARLSEGFSLRRLQPTEITQFLFQSDFRAEDTTVNVRLNLPRSAFVQSPAVFRWNTQVRYRKGQDHYSEFSESR